VAKSEKLPPILSFSASQRQLLQLIERCAAASADKILITTIVSDATQVAGELFFIAAGHPVSVVTSAWTGDEHGSLLIHRAGQCVINLKDLRNIVAAMPNDMLDITCGHDRRFVVEAAGHADKPKRRTFTVYALDPENYPQVARMPESMKRVISGKAIREAIERVRYGAKDYNAKDTAMDACSGVMFEFSKGRLEAVATNGRALAVHRVEAVVADPPEQLLIPGPLLSLVCSLCEEDRVHLAQDEQRVYIMSTHTTATCLKNVGAFPLWRTVVTALLSNAVKMCDLDGLQLAEAARALSTVWKLSYISPDSDKDNRNKGAPVKLELKDHKLRISTSFNPMGSQLAGSEEEIEVSNPEHRTLMRVVESSLLIPGAMGVQGTSSLRSDPNDEVGPVILESADGSFVAVTMPKRADV